MAAAGTATAATRAAGEVIEWARAQGVKMSPALEVREVPGMGLGFVAAGRALQAHEEVLRVPHSAMVLPRLPGAGAVDDAWERLAAVLLHERALGAASRFETYVRFLFSVRPHLPLSWRPRLLAELRGTAAEAAMELTVGDLRAAYAAKVAPLWGEGGSLGGGAAAPGVADFVHAYELVLSRAFGQGHAGGGAPGSASEPCLVPVVCLFNTSPSGGGNHVELFHERDHVSVRTVAPVPEGAQVYLAYSAAGEPLSRADQLLRYGFGGEDNAQRPGSAALTKWEVFEAAEAVTGGLPDDRLDAVEAMPDEQVPLGDMLPPPVLDAALRAALGERALERGGRTLCVAALAALAGRNSNYHTASVDDDRRLLEELREEADADKEEEEDAGADDAWAWERGARVTAVEVRLGERLQLAAAMKHYGAQLERHDAAEAEAGAKRGAADGDAPPAKRARPSK